jgi:hypothetical protein
MRHHQIWYYGTGGMLTTTQFYSIAIDHGSSGDDRVLGRLQNNNWYYTVICEVNFHLVYIA